MGKNVYDLELPKTKANIKPESNLKVAQNTSNRELGGISVSVQWKLPQKVYLKTSKGNSFLEKFMWIKYLEKNNI